MRQEHDRYASSEGLHGGAVTPVRDDERGVLKDLSVWRALEDFDVTRWVELSCVDRRTSSQDAANLQRPERVEHALQTANLILKGG